MERSSAMTTCVPVEYDQNQWRSTVFFEVGGKECKGDRERLQQSTKPFAISLEADMIGNDSAAVVMLRFEIHVERENPLVGEVLVAPGMGDVQFETIAHLTRQPCLDFYFADAKYNVIHSQQLSLQDRERNGYQSILDDAVRHDAMIRLIGRYDAIKALKEIVANYAKRKNA